MKHQILACGAAVILAAPLFAQAPAPGVSLEPQGQNSYHLDWTGEDGWTYFFHYSVDLQNWLYLEEISQGVVHDPLNLTPTYVDELEQEWPYPEFYVRLRMSAYPTLDPKGADFDGDGLTNWQELTIWGTDPLDSDSDDNGFPDGQDDSDLDGISDQWEEMLILQLADPLIVGIEDINGGTDADGDGVLDYQEYQGGLFGYLVDSDGDGYSDRLSVDQTIHWKLDDASGPTAVDSGPDGRNGSLSGSPTWQTTGGIAAGALEFGGGSDAVDIPETAFDGHSDLTVSLWFRTSSIATTQALFSTANASRAPELGISLEQTTVPADTIRIHAGGGESFDWVRNRSLADGLWHHIVLVRDFTSSEVTLHLDGESAGTQSGTLFALLDVGAATLGQKHTGLAAFDSGAAFVGLLDDLRVYSAQLGSDHALELFQPNDLDADGLPDDWELAQVGNLGTLVGAADDLDADGLSNRQEFDAGSDPDNYYNGLTPVVTLISGSGQTIFNGQRTSNPLVFRVTSDGSAPLVGAPVTLKHLGLLGSVESLDGDILASSLTLTTDSNGEVSVHFKAD